MKEDSRVLWVDTLKGLGIILVVFGHMEISDPLGYWIYSFHMPLFFLISGYVFNYLKYSSVKAFAGNRFRTILIPFLLFSLISMAVSVLEKVVSSDKIDIVGLLVHFIKTGGVEVNSPLWFLKSLFLVEVIYFILSRMIKSKWGLFIAVSLPVLAVMILGFEWFVARDLKALFFYGTGNILRQMKVGFSDSTSASGKCDKTAGNEKSPGLALLKSGGGISDFFYLAVNN